MMKVHLFILIGVTLAASTAGGDRAFRAGEYDRSVAEYRRALQRGDQSATLHYNLGTALLRSERFGEAREHLTIAARSDDPVVRQHAYYNLGSTHLEPAFRAPSSPERTDALQQAVRAYRGALLLDSRDVDAKWNLELVQRLLEEEGSGGAEDDPQQGGGGGGGGEDDQAPSRPDLTPAPASGAGAAPQMTRSEAERVLKAAAERDASLQQQKLRRTQAPPPNVRDW